MIRGLFPGRAVGLLVLRLAMRQFECGARKRPRGGRCRATDINRCTELPGWCPLYAPKTTTYENMQRSWAAIVSPSK